MTKNNCFKLNKNTLKKIKNKFVIKTIHTPQSNKKKFKENNMNNKTSNISEPEKTIISNKIQKKEK